MPRYLADLTYEEVRELVSSGVSVAIVPVGSVEPHGPHLPLQTDTTISETCAARAADKHTATGLPTVVAPRVADGVSE
jgi:creatinine amidohydrolase